MAREHEIKLLVPDGFEVPPFDDLCAATPATVVEQTATYYDTPDLRLARAGASLRHRSDDGWTVKLATATCPSDRVRAMVRNEFVFGGLPTAPPPDALSLVAALVRTARLAPVARLHTARTRSELGGVGTFTDDRTTVLEGHLRAQFRELELELTDDAPAPLVAELIARLRESGAGDPDPVPKVVRALGPSACAPPDIVTYPVESPATVDAVIRRAIADSAAKLIENDPVVRIGEDPEGVHQARVATRRLRSHLRTFRALLEPEWDEQLRDELGWLGAELGTVRDADVLLDRLQTRVATLDHDDDRLAAVTLTEGLVRDRDTARETLLDSMRSDRYLQLLDRLVNAAHRPRVVIVVGMDHAETLRGLVRAPWRHLRNAVDALTDPTPDAALHEVRIRAKRARYAAEVVEPAFGKPAREFAKAITGLQGVLGEHQDAVVAGAWLRAHARTLSDPAAVFVAGELGALEHAAAEASRAEFPAAWRRARAKRLRKWL
jgi:CHAD domain-containing protein